MIVDSDQALDQLRLASMAYALGDATESETALRRAVGPMTTFRAEGEFAAMLGAESRKDWKGERTRSGPFSLARPRPPEERG